MRIPPLAVLLSWPTPNYDHPYTHGPALLIVNAICISLVVIALVGRLYSRVVIKQWYGVDDSMIILSLIFTVGMTTVVVLANQRYGWDRHEWDIPTEMIEATNKIAFAAKLMFTLAATFTRLSLIAFYYRLVKDTGVQWFRWVLHFSVVWTIAVCIQFICETIWLCNPVEAYWIFPPLPNGHCLNEGTVMLTGGIINCLSDLLTTLLPIPIVARLQMPVRQRIGVCILLCLGFIVTIAGIIRTYFIWKSLIADYDETWYAYPLWIAAAVEIDLAVICACAPAWKSLLHQPITLLSSALSNKFSSLRSPSTSQATPSSSSHGKSASLFFNPLRSLPWFQITWLDFGHDRSHTLTSHHHLEEPDPTTTHRNNYNNDVELAQGLHYPSSHHHDPGSRSFRHSEIVPSFLQTHHFHTRIEEDAAEEEEEEESAAFAIRPATPGTLTPSLLILKRQSVEQDSEYIGPPAGDFFDLDDGEAAAEEGGLGSGGGGVGGGKVRRSAGMLVPGQWLGGCGTVREGGKDKEGWGKRKGIKKLFTKR